MVVGFGLDIVEVRRIERLLASDHAARFLERVFTARERTFCDAVKDRANRYAARFAAKEAALKALGAPAGLQFREVEVVREKGPPRLVFSGAVLEAVQSIRADRSHLTLTHDGGIAAAAVILEATAT
ncbi:MAG TPA: holo-ACP synthase [Anaeromyxobacteraceae bacterium]|nr:holo-ACP synthase [Anaeromyxobacteraceae bacterium]